MERNLATLDDDVNKQVDGLAGQPYTLDTRMRLLVSVVTSGKHSWANLAAETGIAAERWRQFGRGSTRVSVDMVEAVAQRWPQYAFWLTTGVSDEKHGHHAPHPMWAFPRFSEVFEFAKQGFEAKPNFPKTTAYFSAASKLAKEVWEAGTPREPMPLKGARKAEKDVECKGELQILQAMWRVKEDIECQ